MKMIKCSECGHGFDRADPRAFVRQGVDATCPLCTAMWKAHSASWAYRNDCQGLFCEAFYSKADAEKAMATARGGDTSPDWRVVPVVMIEAGPESFAYRRAYADESSRDQAAKRARHLADLAAMDGEHL